MIAFSGTLVPQTRRVEHLGITFVPALPSWKIADLSCCIITISGRRFTAYVVWVGYRRATFNAFGHACVHWRRRRRRRRRRTGRNLQQSSHTWLIENGTCLSACTKEHFWALLPDVDRKPRQIDMGCQHTPLDVLCHTVASAACCVSVRQSWELFDLTSQTPEPIWSNPIAESRC